MMKLSIGTVLLLGGAGYVAWKAWEQKKSNEAAAGAAQVPGGSGDQFGDPGSNFAAGASVDDFAPPDLAGLSGVRRAHALGNIHATPWWRDQVSRRLRQPPLRLVG